MGKSVTKSSRTLRIPNAMDGGFRSPRAVTGSTFAARVEDLSAFCTGKKCFVRRTKVPTGVAKWKIFTSEEDFESHSKFRKHKR